MYILVLILIIGAILFGRTFFWKVPKNHYAVPMIFGERKSFNFKEGLHIWPPSPIGDIQRISLAPRLIEVDVIFQLKDELEMTTSVAMPYAPDPKLQDPNTKINKFSSITENEEAILKKNAQTFLKEKFGIIAGRVESQTFLDNLATVGAILNAMMRLKNLPHLNHDKTTCGVSGCTMEKMVPSNKILSFYKTHWQIVKALIDNEKLCPEERSTFEEDWGIDIGRITFSQPRYSTETQKARESVRQAEKRTGAVKEVIGLVAQAETDAHLEPSDAQALVEKVMDPQASKAYLTIQGKGGEGNVLVLGDLLGRKTQTQDGEKKTKRGDKGQGGNR